MQKPRFNLRHFTVAGAILCLSIFTACENLAGDDTTPSPKKPTENTWVEFKNLEKFSVVIYSDPGRYNVFTEVQADGTKKVPASPNNAGTAFYPTFHIDLPGIEGMSTPYDGPTIITLIEENKTTPVPIPKLESISIDKTFLKLINNSNFSLSLQEGDLEKAPLGGRPNIVIPGQSATYEINHGPSSGYTVRRNTTTPIAFPAGLTDFRRGIVYVLTYNGTSLSLTAEQSVLQTIPPDVPENVQTEVISTNSARITWNEVSGALSYQVYRTTSAEGTYSSVGTSVTTSYTNASLSAGQAYYYKITALSGGNRESAKSTAAVAIMPPANVRVTVKTINSVSLAWNAFSGASGYNIYRSGSEDGIYSKVNTAAVTGAEFTNTSLSQDVTYWYKVSVIVDGAEGLPSSQIPASTSSIPDVRVTARTANSISLAWNVVSEESGYNVYRSDSENGIYNQINTGAVTGTEFTDTDLSQDAIYWYKVSAIINGIEGIQSSPVSAVIIVMGPGSGLAEKLSWLQTNALSNVDYIIEVTAAESIGPTTLSYSNKTNIGITLRGMGAARTVSLSSNGAMFTVASGVTLVLDNNITLQGRSSNNYSLVRVNAGGTLVMNTGSRITGNTSSGNGGGVYVSGTFTMSGGTVSGNTASGSSSYGGGVFVIDGTFTKTGGTINGYSASDTVNSNVVKNSSGAVVNNRGHAVYAYYSNSIGTKGRGTTAGTGVNMSCYAQDGVVIFSEGWDPSSGGSTEADSIPLTANTWANGTITGGSAVWYSFNVTNGTTYRVWWNDSHQGNSTKTLDVKVSASYSNGLSNGTSIFTNIDSGWSTAQSFSANTNGVVRIKVEPYSGSGSGTFAVVYSTGSTRP